MKRNRSPFFRANKHFSKKWKPLLFIWIHLIKKRGAQWGPGDKLWVWQKKNNITWHFCLWPSLCLWVDRGDLTQTKIAELVGAVVPWALKTCCPNNGVETVQSVLSYNKESVCSKEEDSYDILASGMTGTNTYMHMSITTMQMWKKQNLAKCFHVSLAV